MFLLFFQELLAILFLIIVVIPSAPKIKIMTTGAQEAVPLIVKEPGGTMPVVTPA